MITLQITPRLAKELRQWADDEKNYWPTDTAYQRDLDHILAQLKAADK